MDKVERWGTIEIDVGTAPAENPFLDVTLDADFRLGHRTVSVEGFWDDPYKVRFMPDEIGTWSWTIRSNHAELDGKTGQLECVAPTGDNHGPVRVSRQYHFAYADGAPYYPVGTTCYAWVHQGDVLEKTTLETLAAGPFNKIRMCVFPKHYRFNANEPEHYAFEGSPPKGWDWARFSLPFFRHLERRLGELRDLGIEADIILFHPYDRWGFSEMDAATDTRYLRYVMARLSSFRNVWWSMANEYDLMPAKDMAAWDGFFKTVQRYDPYDHLRGVHNCRGFYDHAKPWVTHVSVQWGKGYYDPVADWRAQYGKPVVMDECGYEGNINMDWGNLPAEELVRRAWETTARGGYPACHGETYRHPEDVLWWAKGGPLGGESPARFGFLRRLLEEAPHGLEPAVVASRAPCIGREGEYYLVYFGIKQPIWRELSLPEGRDFHVDVIDTWEMTVVRLEGAYTGGCTVELPGKPFTALRITSS